MTDDPAYESIADAVLDAPTSGGEGLGEERRRAFEKLRVAADLPEHEDGPDGFLADARARRRGPGGRDDYEVVDYGMTEIVLRVRAAELVQTSASRKRMRSELDRVVDEQVADGADRVPVSVVKQALRRASKAHEARIARELDADHNRRLELTYDAEKDKAAEVAKNRRLAQLEGDRRARAEQAEGLPSLRSSMLSASALTAMPPIEYVVAGILPTSAMGIILGHPGAGKSFVALSLATAVASGDNWLGRVTKKGNVLYIAAEGEAGMGSRLAADVHIWKHKIADGALTFITTAPDFSNSSHVDELVDIVKEREARLIIVDTFARVIPGLDENSAGAMSGPLAAADRIRRAHPGATILLVHHLGKGGLLRGSSALTGAADQILSLTGESPSIELEITKAKEGMSGKVARLQIKKHLDSAVIEGAASSGFGDAALAPRAEEALALFRAAFSESGATKVQWRDLLVSDGMPMKSAYNAINRLAMTGQIVIKANRCTLAPGLELDPS